MSGFILDGTAYPWALLSEITVGDQIRVERWLRNEGAELTEARTWEDVLKIAEEVNSRGDFAQQRLHPEFKLSLVMAIWAGKRAAGEQVLPGDCLGWTWDELDFYAEPGDEGKG